jgi:hypothetical protein
MSPNARQLAEAVLDGSARDDDIELLAIAVMNLTEEPRTIDEAADHLDKLRVDVLFDENISEDLDPLTEQHFILAITAAETAVAQLRLAHIHQRAFLASEDLNIKSKQIVATSQKA